MNRPAKQSAFRFIPSVDEILASPELQGERERFQRFPWTHLVRTVVARYRDGEFGELAMDRETACRAILHATKTQIESLHTGGMRVIVNATGVILHTNLGRARLGAQIQAAISEAASHYVNLEISLDNGQRSKRGEVLNSLVCMATEAEAAMIVNNNAAAVYLVVGSYSPPGRVIVSRGELIEIGGSFRLPDILDSAAQSVVEVGTTNRTYVADYERVAKPGDIFFRAHRSNYDIHGFTHEATLAELVALAKERECFVVYDLGSGSLADLIDIPIDGEESVREIVATGVDCITMSGDKLLGGPQAGIIVGKASFLRKLETNPLKRAVRVDKITIAALQALLRAYLFDSDPAGAIPALDQVTMKTAALKRRAGRIIKKVGDCAPYRLDSDEDKAVIGGGSLAGRELDSVAVVVYCANERDATAFAKKLRQHKTPVLARVGGTEVRLNLRSVAAEADDTIVEALQAVLNK